MNVHKKEKKNYIVLLYAFIHIIIYKTKKNREKEHAQKVGQLKLMLLIIKHY